LGALNDLREHMANTLAFFFLPAFLPWTFFSAREQFPLRISSSNRLPIAVLLPFLLGAFLFSPHLNPPLIHPAQNGAPFFRKGC